MFDQECKGYITGEDLLGKVVEFGLDIDVVKILQRFDSDGDAKLSYSEFSKIITPVNIDYQQRSGHSPSCHYNRSPYRDSYSQSSPAKSISYSQTLQLRQSEWVDDLKEVLFTVGKAEQLLVHTRNSLNIDAAAIFEQVDSHKLGYFTARSLSEWLAESVGFRLSDFETKLLFNRYDRQGRYSVGLSDFVEEVRPVQEEEEEGVYEEEGGAGAVPENNHQAQEDEEEAGDSEGNGAAAGIYQEEFEQEEEDDEPAQNGRDMRRRYLSGNEEDLAGEPQPAEGQEEPEADDDAKYLEGLQDDGEESP